VRSLVRVDVHHTRRDLMADIRWSRKTIAAPDTAVRTPKAREAVVPSSMLKLVGRVIRMLARQRTARMTTTSKMTAIPDMAVRTPKAHEAAVLNSMLKLVGKVIKTPAIRMTATVRIPETVVRTIARPITKREVVHQSSTPKRAAKATKIANYLIVV
jgi:hypothetical protein